MNPRDIHSLDQIVMLEQDMALAVETLAHHVIDGVYTKVFRASKAGTILGQHSHAYDHGTLVANGALRVFLDGREAGDYGAGEMVLVVAGRKHVFLTLEDDTVAACIHNVRSAEEPEIYEKTVFA